jgi:BTB/POZ domain
MTPHLRNLWLTLHIKSYATIGPHPLKPGLTNLSRFLETGQYSDFTIRCKGHERNAHKAIICGQSGFFKRLCESGFKVSKKRSYPSFTKDARVCWPLQEAQEGAVDLVDDEPQLVARMLAFIYSPHSYVNMRAWMPSGSTSVFAEAKRKQSVLLPENANTPTQHDPLVMHAKLHGLSKKYDVPTLRSKTCERFAEHVAWIMENENLKCSREEDGDVCDTIATVYDREHDTDKVIKEATTYLARAFVKTLTLQQWKAEDLLGLLHSTDNLAWDLVAMDLTKAKFWCDMCHKKFDNLDIRERCACASRGFCGDCTLPCEMECPMCGDLGGCQLDYSSWKMRTRSKACRLLLFSRGIPE